MTPAALLSAGLEAFATAQGRVGGEDVRRTIAGRPVRFSFAGTGFRKPMARAIAGEEASGEAIAGSPPALTIHIWDAASTGVRMATDSWTGTLLGPVGVIEELSDERYHVSMDIHSSLASLLDARDGVALHYVPDPALLPYWELTHPARLLWAAWARAQGVLMCHAAAVAWEGRGALVVGPSGSGKSTTALSCLNAGMECAGDDYVLVEPGSPVRAHALYTASLLDVAHARAHPSLMPAVDRVAAATPDRSKAVTYSTGGDRPSIRGGFAVAAIIVPRVVRGERTGYAPLSAGHALRALAPSTLSQLGMVDSAPLAALARLCRSLPCFEMWLGTDVEAIPHVVREIISVAERRPVGTLASS